MIRAFAIATLLLVGTAASAQAPISAKVLSCYDGDTCILDREILPGRNRVRLSNADTPEVEGKCAGEIKQAIMARDYTRSMVVGRMVTLTAVEPDKYRKRIDAYVSIDGRDLGDALIAAGWRGRTQAGAVSPFCQFCQFAPGPFLNPGVARRKIFSSVFAAIQARSVGLGVGRG